MALSEDFRLASTYIRQGDKKYAINMDTTQKLQVYGLYKQATEGSCNQPRPLILSFEPGAKWSAWNNLGDMTKEAAQAKYVELITELQPNWRENAKASGIH
uniref:Enyol-CoA hydratase n=1 Tax=Nephromyces sp. MMRI TaxID=2496275 RepID=A0A3Q8UC04_9APIC|nr:enyol-CoA hydratase [Nephromyces sp. MMRI]AZL94641.1 enyol-CoA hydratase [Nephromyces sp. MMRI]AZL94652.1 enyol-CoA hydratase [Nephromyces sp. MMRI]